MESIDRRRALLYVAGQFMMVHIDRCGRTRETRHKRASSQGPKLDKAL